MSSSIRRTIGAAATVVLVVGAYVSLLASTWVAGDVFAGVGQGKYNVYSNTGIFKEQIAAPLTGETTGCAFNSSGDLYTTHFQANKIVKFDGAHPHNVLQTIDAGTGNTPESIVFAANGDFYVGHADGHKDIVKYDSAGTLQQAYDVATEFRGSDWIDLAADQKTIFYTSEGRLIKKFDVSGSGTQLADFATLPGSGNAFALRLLPPGDGTGGLLVADRFNIKRLDAAGAVVQTYDFTGVDDWFALNLDPDGLSFWSGSYSSTKSLYRFNIATGVLVGSPIATGASPTLAGICLKGEPVAGAPPPMPSQEGPQPYTSTTTENNWHFDAGTRSFRLSVAAVNTEFRLDVTSTDTLAPLTTGPFTGYMPVHVTPRGTGAIYKILPNGQPSLPEPGMEYISPVKLKLGWTVTGPVCRPRLLRAPDGNSFTEDKSTGFNFEADVDPVETGESCCMSSWGVFEPPPSLDMASVNFTWIRPSATGADAFKLGRVIPIQFRLTKAGLPITTEMAYINIARFVGHPPSDAQAIDVNSPGNSQDGTLFKHIGDGVYQYNWQTKGEVEGFYNISVLLQSTCFQMTHASLKEK
jgi:streptogramin lyase